ncbi:hypothetical protein POTOM_014052 [Populus tomentosa]|uniref:Uncharacterized protein n=1 Tax=Populus tomentosa TaxID=118781 RepID=A0A8X8A1V9_POPTO|nr:hypothetical protein POTOM_014052 [Populus tomentosa]
MASCQCSKPVEPPCNQDQKNHSSGQKVEKQAKGGVVKTGTHSSSQTLSPGSTNARTNKRGERKRSLLQRIKDGISGHSDGGGGGSSSSSESESDDEKCGQRKAKLPSSTKQTETEPQDQKNHSSGQRLEEQAEGGVVKTGTHSSSQTHSPGGTNGMTPAPACNARTHKRGERKLQKDRSTMASQS